MRHVYFDYPHIFWTPLFQTVLPVLHRLPALAHLVIRNGAYPLSNMELPPGYELSSLRRLTFSGTSFAAEFMFYCCPREIEAAGCGQDLEGSNVFPMMFLILKKPAEERCLITRLYLRCGCCFDPHLRQPKEYCRQGSYFQEMLRINASLTLPCLEELVLSIPFVPELLGPHSLAFCGSQLRRMHLEWCIPSRDPLDLPSFEIFPLLEELSLLSIQSARQLIPQLRNAPRLAHLICSSASKRNYAEKFALELGAQLEQLESLSHGAHTARIHRGDMGEIEISMHAYHQRDWLMFGAYDLLS
ncbi:hypothetical protein BDZ89DRAFT_660972 [Hymenopellis radicata]|nr:hypothetical protein BDZ89DRAFT_660972 [Hymenopellis radicata]